MKKQKIDLFLFVSLILSLFCVSASFLLIAIDSEKTVGSIPLPSFIAALVFWLFLVIAAVSQIILSLRCKKFFAKRNSKHKDKIYGIGLISFFKNKIGLVADIFLILCAVAFVAVFIVTGGIGFGCYIVITLLLLSLCMHSIFNGKLFFYICALKKADRKCEKKSNKKGKVENNE